MSIARGLVGWWRMDGNLTDASGNGNNGTVGAGSAAYAAGVYGQAWDNDATRYVTIPATYKTENMTLAFWVFPTNFSNVTALLSDRSATRNGVTIWQGISLGTLKFDFAEAASTHRWDTGFILPLNVWAHVVLTRTPQGRALYVDGALNASTTDAGGMDLTNNDYTIIGARGNDFSGRALARLDNLKIFNRALTPSEIKTLYALGSPL